jgi:hypothetical protein
MEPKMRVSLTASVRLVSALVMLAVLTGPVALEAQPGRAYQVGVIYQGGSYVPAIDGMVSRS